MMRVAIVAFVLAASPAVRGRPTGIERVAWLQGCWGLTPAGRDFDLPAALENAMTLVKERAHRHGIRLGLKVDPGLGEFRGDERKFKQIMLNLLSNAVKFAPDGGSVEIVARLSGSTAEVSVIDTGVGIAPADQAAVFEEFKQVGGDSRARRQEPGSAWL